LTEEMMSLDVEEETEVEEDINLMDTKVEKKVDM